MNAELWQKIPLDGLDEWTRAEISLFIERKFDEYHEIKGQLARDLAEIGEMAFLDPKAYDKLEAKYRASRHLREKTLAILKLMRKENCKCVN